jgi:hypothetical protein
MYKEDDDVNGIVDVDKVVTILPFCPTLFTLNIIGIDADFR